jgi:dUTP pyrophosphatase
MMGYNYFEVKKLTDSSQVPSKGHPDDAGWDLYADESFKLWPEETKLISTGIAMSLPKGFVGLIWDRSSIGVKGIHRYAGVIDCGYRGEVKVCLHNTTKGLYHIEKGDRIAQILIQEAPNFRIHIVDELDSTNRGDGGFGSTGK